MWRPPAFANHPASFHAPTWRAFCHEIVDGDTYTCLIDLGFLAYSYQRIRLRGLDTPEVVGPEATWGLAAKQRATELLLNQPVLLTVHRDERTFERWVADVQVYDFAHGLWLDVASTLRSNGHEKVRS